MSAIWGLFWRNGEPASPDLLDLMMERVAHWGPDGHGTWYDGPIGLGHQFLHTTPESLGEKQPLVQGALALTADVRLDNRQDLIARLQLHDRPPNALTDSHLILAAWQKWGPQCARYLIGDFAFALWDESQRTLFCVRDHIGVMPFYYVLTSERFLFASDIKPLLVVPGVSRQLNEAYIAAYLQELNFTHQELTFYESVRKLPPAHTLTITPSAIREACYWRPEDAPDVRHRNDEAYAEGLREVVQQAVSARLRTTYPVGAHLSGGLDSSTIATLANRDLRQRGQRLSTFTWFVAEKEEGQPVPEEQQRLEAICQQEDFRPSYQEMGVDAMLRVFCRDVTCEPTVDVLFYELLIQQQAAAQGIRVLLSGWGGDEGATFNGRGYYPALLRRGQWRTLYQQSLASNSTLWRFVLQNAILPLMPFSLQRTVARLRGQRLAPRLYLTSYIHPDLARRTRQSVARLISTTYPTVGVRQMQIALLTYGHITARLESWAASAAQQQIVYRYPLLDRRVLDYALGVPPEQYRRGRQTRFLARRAFAPWLPSKIVHGGKREVVRVNNLFSVRSEAWTMISNQLERSLTMPPRAEYVELMRLRRQLKTDHTGMFGHGVLPALLLLDLRAIVSRESEQAQRSL